MGIAIALVVLSLFFGLLERWFGALPARSIWRRDRAIDFLYWFLTPLLSRAISAVLAGATFIVLSRMTGRSLGSSWFASQPLPLQWLEVLIGGDLTGYFSHRLFHRNPLWRFHAIHHSIQELDWLAGVRVHVLDQLVTKGISMLPLLVLGFDAVPIVISAGIYFWHSILLHANVRMSFGPLRWVIASPEFHHWHHAARPDAYGKNFAGQLSILDKLFGTMYMPEGQTPERYGLEDPVPHNYISQMLYPFKWARLIH